MVELSKAKPDGHTLGMVTVELAMFPHQGKATVTNKDYVSVCAPIAAPAALIVTKEAPYNNLDEFVKYAKDNTGKVSMGNSGTGAIWHIAALNFEKEFGVKFKQFPIRREAPTLRLPWQANTLKRPWRIPVCSRARLMQAR